MNIGFSFLKNSWVKIVIVLIIVMFLFGVYLTTSGVTDTGEEVMPDDILNNEIAAIKETVLELAKQNKAKDAGANIQKLLKSLDEEMTDKCL